MPGSVLKPLRHLAVLGDIHAEDTRLAAALAFLAAHPVDTILSVGDIVDGDGDVNRCCDLLAAHHVLTVRGNHDRWLFEDTLRDLPNAHRVAELSDSSRRFLSALPATRTLETVAGPLLLCHGLLDDDMRRLTPDDDGYELQCNEELQSLLARRDLPFLLGGHTHRRMVRRFGHVTVFNAGTLHRVDQPCVLLIDFASREARFYDVEDDLRITDAERIPF